MQNELNIKVLNNNDNINEIKNILQNFIKEIVDEYLDFDYDKKKETNQQFNIVRTYLHDNIDIELLKDVLDELLNLHREFRYELKIYNNTRKYPLTIRINKKGKKVITKRQTKMLSL